MERRGSGRSGWRRTKEQCKFKNDNIRSNDGSNNGTHVCVMKATLVAIQTIQPRISTCE